MLGSRMAAAMMLGLCLCGCATPPRGGGEARVVPNDNRAPAGVLRDGVLTLRLDVREARWFPDGDDGPGEVVRVFAQDGGVPQNPGPLIRVPVGTQLRLTVRNPLPDSSLVIHGLHSRPGPATDTVQIAPGSSREVSFMAGAPGTYFYWGTTTHAAIDERHPMDMQLQGAFVVDSATGAPSRDRIFVLGSWNAPPDSSGPPPHVPRDIRVINGLSWPHTERFSYTVGDTVSWRWVNATTSAHPMHLHGFYFAVTNHGTWAADTVLATSARRNVVTETVFPGETFAMQWTPEEPGNWLMHCHIAFHVSHFLSFDKIPDPPDPIAPAADHSVHGMRGMILGITVAPGTKTEYRAVQTSGARELRLVAQSAPKRYVQSLEGLAYVLQDGREPAPDSVPIPSSPIILRRGEPVAITVVNHLRAPTAVHWHGMELPSFSDGVPGWSGTGAAPASMIAPGDSFVARFTPPRAGTFMYHSHTNELFQINMGLYGALLVVDPSTYDPARERVFVVGGNGPVGGSYGAPPAGETFALVNGKTKPDTVRMTVGSTYRLRFIQIHPDFLVAIALRSGERVLQWRPIAKDGRDLEPAPRDTRSASVVAGPGETADFEFTPRTPGALTLEIRSRSNEWTINVPVVVARPMRDEVRASQH